jgi:hypothetical protein
MLSEQPNSQRDLPRLAYIGDGPVESSYHGSLLVYRLLSGYPKDKLLIVETDLGRSAPERRLPNVEYRKLTVPFARLAKSRFSKIYSSSLFLSARFRARSASRDIQDFGLEAIVSVAHGYHWLTAARVAKQLGLPFHLIVYDHLPDVTALPHWLRPNLERTFQQIYRQAQTRFCVSPYMDAEYNRRYGVAGTLLYPSRGPDYPAWDTPPTGNTGVQRLRIAFAGSIESGGYADLLRTLAESLEADDELFLFGPHTRGTVKNWNLDMAAIKLGGLLPSGDLLGRLRQDFDVLFVPMSFYDRGHSTNMRLAFPSKLADYTAVGLPLLICGPDYCSAVRWARENAPVAEIVSSKSAREMREAIGRLRSADYRELLGRRALNIGATLFSYERAQHIFCSALAA